MTGVSEFEDHCTFLIHPSCHEYSAHSTSFAGSLAQAAGVTEKFMGDPTMTSQPNIPHQVNLADLQRKLESSRDHTKLEALKEIILWTIQSPSSTTEFLGIIGGNTSCKTPTNVASRLLVTIIRYVLPSENHKIKRYLQLYWETVDKADQDGSLKEEMILVCNKWRQDLLHPNEYIRGTTLRLLSKMRYVKVLQPLIESIIQNLNNSHTYVRRNAIMCEYAIVRTFGANAIVHSPKDIIELLTTESDVSCKRNLFLMLMYRDISRAVEYALSLEETIFYLGDVFQLAFLELIRRLLYTDAANATKLLPLVIALANNSTSPAVSYEGAQILLFFPSTSSSITTAIRNYIALLLREADNNIKLSVLDRLEEILQRYPEVLESFAVDIFRVLSSPSQELRKKALLIGFKLITPRTSTDIFAIIRKEILKTLALENQQTDITSLTAYQQFILMQLTLVSGDYAELIAPMLRLLIQFLTDRNASTAAEVAKLFRKMAVLHPYMRHDIVNNILDVLSNIPHPSVSRTCLWIVGEFSCEEDQRERVIDTIFTSLLPLPFPEDVKNPPNTETMLSPSNSAEPRNIPSPSLNAPDNHTKVTIRTVVLQDGTYGTKNIYEKTGKPNNSYEICLNSDHIKEKVSGLRSLILLPDFLLASVVAVTVTKVLVNSLCTGSSDFQPVFQKNLSRCLLIAASLYQTCTTYSCCSKTSATAARISQVIHILLSLKKDASLKSEFLQKWISTTKEALQQAFHFQCEIQNEFIVSHSTSKGDIPDQVSSVSLPEEVITFRQPGHLQECHEISFSMERSLVHPDVDLNRALGKDLTMTDSVVYQKKLLKAQQLTGLDDPLYVEAFIQGNQFNFTIEFLMINRVDQTLQKISIELVTHGDLKLVEQPHTFNLSPGMSRSVRIILEVTSTETAILFGHITFQRSPKGETEYLVLNELHIDLLEFIESYHIDSSTFRRMWAEFEWENKIAINTCFTDITQYIQHLIKKTNMTIIGNNSFASTELGSYPNELPIQTNYSSHADFADTLPYPTIPWSINLEDNQEHLSASQQEKQKQDSCIKLIKGGSSLFAVNLYCKSIFDEDTLANVSIEKLSNGKLTGSIRIRSRTQGIALSLGDLITIAQRSCPEQAL